MKRFLKLICFGCLISFLMGLGTFSWAAEEKPAEAAQPTGKTIPEDLIADFNLSLYSQYIWRGYELSKDSMVIFPQLTLGYKGFAVTTWVDLDTSFKGSADKAFKLQETDVIVTYSNSIAPLKLNYTVGWILYDYQPLSYQVIAPNAYEQVNGRIAKIAETKTQEIFLTLGVDTILKPTLSIYQEIEKGRAWYFNLGISHSLPVYKDWTLDMALTASYYHNQNGEDPNLKISAFHDGNLSVGLKIPLNKYVSIKPNLQWSFPLSQAAANRIKYTSFTGHNNTFVYGGIIFDVAI